MEPTVRYRDHDRLSCILLMDEVFIASLLQPFDLASPRPQPADIILCPDRLIVSLQDTVHRLSLTTGDIRLNDLFQIHLIVEQVSVDHI